jgi:cysteine desulfuration protein SufE
VTTNTNIETKIESLIQDMKPLKSAEERYKWIIGEGKKLSPLSEEQRQDKFLIEGCISRAWLVPEKKDSQIHLFADSESMIVKGIMALLLRVYSGETGPTILATEPLFLREVGVQEHLSLNRRNGLASVIKQIKMYGIALQ